MAIFMPRPFFFPSTILPHEPSIAQIGKEWVTIIKIKENADGGS
jgi:hypothetical protein